MIFKFEEKALKWLADHIMIVVFIAATIVSIAIRFFLKDFLTTDAMWCLLPWYDAIKANGGLGGLGTPVEGLNYSFTYQFFIAVFTYLPINALYCYKIFSCIFDYLLAGAIAYLVYDLASNKKRELALLAFILVSCSPLVFMDSAAWGQCDSIYSFWIVMALIFLRKEKYLPTFIFYGVAFAFKFQAIFVMPFFLFYYFYKRRFSILYFFLIPVMMVVLALPSLVQGRTISEMIHIYTDNTSLHQSLANGYPTFWRVLADGTNFTGEDAYGVLKHAAMAFTVIVLGCLVYAWVKKAVEFTGKNIVIMAFIMTYTTIFFLPAMHERYGFSYEILAIVIAIMVAKTIPLAVGLTCLSLTTYGAYLFNNTTNEWFLSVVNLILYISYMIILNKELIGIEKAEV
ncbi:glycosyltransferase 87 family protein [Pseudobutyrivibrio ruminis]|uniref:Mannosyltransferase related to Gpi18 n=1 Tax=Pseudobutyrivibrio ruminis DSM 9787 TaxID=1123011 RepID=A0A285S9R4_9FIRM|nr:glycosyltransferase 87 family protein [Pseudobutyrivibrio ruminis]SOC04121.1 Protein of unknown function [Pseudobutyrivibrio ruminis DSM 9787]